MLKIPTKTLILVAASVWLIAGFSVTSVGLTSAPAAWSAPIAIALLLVFAAFATMFLFIARKHVRRICAYTDAMTSIVKFMDPQSYIMLVVMIAFGAALRLSGLIPGFVIAPLYSGIGLALTSAAVYYLSTYIAICDELVCARGGRL
jgi:hypothetical protein